MSSRPKADQWAVDQDATLAQKGQNQKFLENSETFISIHV